MTELEEKQADCPYCHEPFKEISNENVEATIVFNSKKVSLRMMDSEFYEDNVTIIYCPMCGRKLGEEE